MAVISSTPAREDNKTDNVLNATHLLNRALKAALITLLFHVFTRKRQTRTYLLLTVFFTVTTNIMDDVHVARTSPTKGGWDPNGLLGEGVSFLVGAFSYFLSLETGGGEVGLSVFKRGLGGRGLVGV